MESVEVFAKTYFCHTLVDIVLLFRIGLLRFWDCSRLPSEDSKRR